MTKKSKSSPPSSKKAASQQEDQGKQNNQQGLVAGAQWIAPLPPPSVLNQYEDTIPGAAERIISMAEGEAEHQKYMEKTAMHLQHKENRLGQYFGLATVILSFATTIACAYLGATAAAAIIGGTTVVGLVTVKVKKLLQFILACAGQNDDYFFYLSKNHKPTSFHFS